MKLIDLKELCTNLERVVREAEEVADMKYDPPNVGRARVCKCNLNEISLNSRRLEQFFGSESSH